MSESNIDPKIKDAFNLLDTISEYSQGDLEAAYKVKDKRDSILKLKDELLDPEATIEPSSPDEFIKLVRELRDAKRTWAQNLSKAIILETRKSKSGDSEGAIIVLKDFIRNCPARFYRTMAKNRLDYYKSR